MATYADLGREKRGLDYYPTYYAPLITQNPSRIGRIQHPNVNEEASFVALGFLAIIIVIFMLLSFWAMSRNNQTLILPEISDKPINEISKTIQDPQARIRIEDAIAKYVEEKLK